jgi:hypothetical protein
VKYLMIVCNRDATDPAHEEPTIDAVEPWVEEMDRRKVRVIGDRLRPSSDATTVRIRGGQVVVSDGPYTETKEWIAGFDILECADLDEAIEVASKHPNAQSGALELRPFWPF